MKETLNCSDDGKLTQEDLEAHIQAVIDSCLRKGRLTSQELPLQKLVKILHRAADVFDEEQMLVEVRTPPEGIFITGDVLGSMGDLIQSMNVGGFPPHRTFIFLGNYIEGNKSVECIILLLLLKIRWPDKVYILRGERETDEAIMKFCFNKLCQKNYRNKELYQVFSMVFERMPVAAIVDDSILCCRGGISQWITSRECIRRLPKPPSSYNLNIIERCVLTDILCSQPTFCKKCGPFEPSMCDVAYAYNISGFDAVLKALKVEHLVRAGYVKGITRDFNGKCFTVRTRGRDGVFRGAVLKAKRVGKTNKEHSFEAFTYRSIDEDHVTTRMTLRSLKSILVRNFGTNCALPASFAGPCKHCKEKQTPAGGKRALLISHGEVAEWMVEHAKTMISDDSLLNVIGQRPPNTRILLVQLFPLCYDCIKLGGGTYRVALTDSEREYLAKKSGDSKKEVKVTEFPHCCDAIVPARPRATTADTRDGLPTAKEIAEVEEELASVGIIEVIKEADMGQREIDVDGMCTRNKPEGHRSLMDSLRSLVETIKRRSEKSTKDRRQSMKASLPRTSFGEKKVRKPTSSSAEAKKDSDSRRKQKKDKQTDEDTARTMEEK